MAITTKDEQSEAVRQQHRNAAGAWINGSELKERSEEHTSELQSH